MKKNNLMIYQRIFILILFIILIISNFNTKDINKENKNINSNVTIDETKYSKEVGKKVATLTIPAKDISTDIYYGNDQLDNFNLIMDNDYSYFDEEKNIVLAGHKEKISSAIDKIEKEDIIKVDYKEGRSYYKVDSIGIVEETQSNEVLKEQDKEQLIIYTCYPFEWWSDNSQRYVITASKV
ncbi:sortase [Mycobacterium sp.]|uniref:sortase n=1 Tax=Mycobacterium sp. TaxID=1785 RepID=UPI003A888B80